MIEKVVPLAEAHAARHVLALQYLDESLSLRVFKLENSEFLSGRHILINLERGRIKIVPGYHLNLVDGIEDLIYDLIVFDVLLHHYLGFPFEGTLS
jgi:hypothetical protein